MGWKEIHYSAMTLLKAHDAASKKPVSDRDPLEMYVANLGRNRLKSIVSLAAQKVENQRREDYRHEQSFFNQG